MSDPAAKAIDLDRIRTEATAAVIDRLVQLEIMAILARGDA